MDEVRTFTAAVDASKERSAQTRLSHSTNENNNNNNNKNALHTSSSTSAAAESVSTNVEVSKQNNEENVIGIAARRQLINANMASLPLS